MKGGVVMNTRFEIKFRNFELQIDNSHLYLNLNDGKVCAKITLKDIVAAIEYLVSRAGVTKKLAE